MATAWTQTREQLAANALLKLRIIAPGDTPDANALTAAYDALDGILKEFHALGLLPWKFTTAPVNVAIPAPTSIITGTSWSAGVATFKSTAHGLIVGQAVAILNVVSSSTTYSYNGSFIVATAADANTFTVAMVNDPGTWTSGGTATGSVIAPVSDMLYPLNLNITLDSVDYPVDIVSNRVFQETPYKLTTGRPTICYFDGTAIYMAPVQDKAYTAKLTYQKIINDTAASTAPDVPVAAMRCLADILAAELADSLGVDDARYQFIKAEGKAAEIRLRKVIYVPQTIIPMRADYF